MCIRDSVAIIQDKVIETLLAGEQNQSESAQILTIGAIKYAFLKSDSQKNMYFDIDESVSLNGNSGPYIQYAYARMKSIVRNSMTPGQTEEIQLIQIDETTIDPSERALLNLIPRFCEVVTDAAESYAPHLICTCLLYTSRCV